MNILPEMQEFDHPHICWLCSKERIFYGKWDYCENCEEPHFVCQNCIQEYNVRQKYSITIQNKMR